MAKIFKITERYSDDEYLVIASNETQALNKYKRKLKYKAPLQKLKKEFIYIHQLKGVVI